MTDRDALAELIGNVYNRESAAPAHRAADALIFSGLVMDEAWLAAHDRFVVAEALEAAADEIGDERKAPRAWLRDRAAEIRQNGP